MTLKVRTQIRALFWSFVVQKLSSYYALHRNAQIGRQKDLATTPRRLLPEATSIVLRGHKWIEDPVFDRNTTHSITAMQKNLKIFQTSQPRRWPPPRFSLGTTLPQFSWRASLEGDLCVSSKCKRPRVVVFSIAVCNTTIPRVKVRRLREEQ